MASPDSSRHVLIEDLRVGEQRSFTRHVGEDDLIAAMRLSGDRGGYHTDDAFARAAGFRGRIMPGIFAAGLPTQIGGSLNLLAREMNFGFTAPVYVGDTLTCTVTITALDVPKRRLALSGDVTNQHGVAVLQFSGRGYLPAREWGIPDKSVPV